MSKCKIEEHELAINKIRVDKINFNKAINKGGMVMSTSEELNKKLINLIESNLDKAVKENIFGELQGQGVNINDKMQKISYEELEEQGVNTEELAQKMQQVISEELEKHGVIINWSDEEVKEKISKELVKQGFDIKQPAYGIQKEIFDDLLKEGVNINWQDEQFKTPLMKSIQAENDTIANLLLDNKAQVNITTNSRYTALSYAALKGRTNIAKRLIESGAKLNVRTKGANATPLFYALKNDYKEIAILLINGGADYSTVVNYYEEEKISILDLASKAGNEDVYNLIMEKEQEKEALKLKKREEYIEKITQGTKEVQTLQDTYPRPAIEAYVDLKMGSMADIKELKYNELDGLLQLYSKDKKRVESSKQKEISENELKNELAKDTKVYIRGVDNITGLDGYNSVRTHNEYGGETEARKLGRKAGAPTLTKIKGAKTGNYNRCTMMVNYGKVMPFRTVGYGIIKENIEGIHAAGNFDLYSEVSKADDMIYLSYDVYSDNAKKDAKMNLPIEEKLDSILNYWKNIDLGNLGNIAKTERYNEVVMDVLAKEVKFIYWSKEAKNESKPVYDILQAVYFQRKYYEQTGRTLPIYEYKMNETDYLVETKFTDEDIADMLRKEILDESGKALKEKYNKGGAVDFLMTFNKEINQIENSKEVVKHFIQDRLNEYSNKKNINNVWNVINVIKYAGMNAGIMMEDKDAFKNTLNAVFRNVLDTDTVAGFLKKRENGARFTSGKKDGEVKDIAAVIGLLAEIREVAKDKTMEFLKPEIEQILESKMMEITQGIKTNIMLPLTMAKALGDENINLMRSVIEEGIDLNSECIEGKTPLMYAAENGQLTNKTLKVLLDAGADINYVNSDGRTALKFALEHRKSNTIEKLLQKGANINKHDVIYGAQKGDFTIIKVLGDKVNDFVDINETDNEGKTVLIYAVQKGSLRDYEEVLKNREIDINKADNSGKTALMYLIQDGNVYNMNELLKRGARVNEVDKEGKTALMYAVEANETRMVELLIENGASVENVEINDKMSPEIAQIVKDAKDEQNKELSQSKHLTNQDIMELKENMDNIKSKIQAIKDLTSDIKKVEKTHKNDLINDRRLARDRVDNLSKSRIDSGMERPM